MEHEPFDWIWSRLGNVHRESAAAPRRIGRYDVREELGHGGAGRVFRAFDTVLKRDVALKLLTWAADDARIRREAEAAARLQHPHIVTVFDVGQEAQGAYLAMELVEGAPLAEVWKNWPEDRKARAVEQIARAVGYAHQKGVVHRDLKPGNVMVTPQGDVKILDLGLARVEGVRTMTRTGDILGTPAYMAPEQVRGERAGPAADIYALGVILYEGLTGCLPFDAANADAMYARILHDDPIPLRRLRPGLPKDLEVVTLRAMERDPRRRFVSAEEFAEDLRRWREGEPIRARPPWMGLRAIKWIRRHKLVSAVSGVVLLGLSLWAADRARVRWLVRRHLALDTEESCEKARLLDPENREVERRLRFHRATRLISEASRIADEYRTARAEAVELGRKAAALEGQERQFEWEDKLSRAQERMEALFSRTIGGFSAALSANPGDVRVPAAMARLYFERFVEAEQEGNLPRAFEFREAVRRFDTDRLYESRLLGQGSLTLETTARVLLSKFEDGGDGRWVLHDERALNGPVRALPLESGSYLLVLQAEGKRDTRVPVRIVRDVETIVDLPLYSEEESGADFVYVPGGEFVMGGDPRSMGAGPRQLVKVPRFFISRFEIRTREYAEFLSALGSDAVKHLPRGERPERPSGWRIEDGKVVAPVGQDDWPVHGVSFGDAEAYCRWRTSVDPKASYSLPTEEQWEKAARGVDARFYPWGNGFMAAYCNNYLSSGGSLKPVGSFPDDVSPYGVFDMAGGVIEWCAPRPEDRDEDERPARGGSWRYDYSRDFRCAVRDSIPGWFAYGGLGFRVVRTPK